MLIEANQPAMGPTLVSQIDACEEGLSVRDAIGWVTRLAKTVAAIHAQGRVHGAICPHAIVTDDGACEASGFLAHPDDVTQPEAYHSSERAHGHPATPADDVWAIAVTLYYAVTGRLPYKRGVKEWLAAGREQMPPLVVAGEDMAVMQTVLEGFLQPTLAPEEIPPADHLLATLRSFSPQTKDLERLRLVPKHGDEADGVALPPAPSVPTIEPVEEAKPPRKKPPLPPRQPEPEVIDLGSSRAVLMSLPPAPLSVAPPEPKAPPAPTRSMPAVMAALAVGLGLGVALCQLLLH